MPGRQRLFSFRGWFLFLCFTFVIIYRLVYNGPIDYIGLLLIAAGWTLRLAAAFYIADHTNKNVPSGNDLAVSGTYGISRNPMYLGNLLICEGVLLLSNCFPWLLHIALLTLVFLYYRQVVIQEENFLREKFGKAYMRYLEQTPRWADANVFFKSNDWKPVSPLRTVLRVQWPNAAKTAMIIFTLWLTQ